MKKLITAAISLLFVACLSYTAIAGSLDSPGAPSAGSGMYTLQNLYDYLTSGTALTVQSSFQEPTSGPGSTMKTTKEIGDAIKDKFNLCAATADNVEQGVTFFCTQPGSWGVRTGTLSALPSPTATPTIPPKPAYCTTAGGIWAPDGLGSYGCWLQTSSGQSCAARCSSVSLACMDGNVDDPGCAVCKSIHGDKTCLGSSSDGWMKPFYYTVGDNCHERGTDTQPKDCNYAQGNILILCVCKQ